MCYVGISYQVRIMVGKTILVTWLHQEMKKTQFNCCLGGLWHNLNWCLIQDIVTKPNINKSAPHVFIVVIAIYLYIHLKILTQQYSIFELWIFCWSSKEFELTNFSLWQVLPTYEVFSFELHNNYSKYTYGTEHAH